MKYLIEFSIKDLWASSSGGGSGNAVSWRSRKFYSIRKQFYDEAFLVKAWYEENKGMLTTKWKVTPTYNPGRVINIDPKTGNAKEGSYYTALVQFTGLDELFSKDDWNTLEFKDKKKIIYDIIDSADAKIFSNDPSFLYQGVWKRMDGIEMSAFPFPDLPDKGIWQKRHGASLYLSKHFLGIFSQLKFNVDKMIKAIDEELK